MLQDYILPTHTYVGGPAEIAYFAQSQVLYERLLGGMPNLLHRSGFTLIDGSTAKRLERYSLHLPDFFHGEEALRRRWPRRWPRRSCGRNSARAGTGHGELDGLQSVVEAFDPTLGASLRKSRAKMLYQLGKAEAKVARESMRRSGRAEADAGPLVTELFPDKHLQERYYSVLPFLARHGFELFDTIYANVPGLSGSYTASCLNHATQSGETSPRRGKVQLGFFNWLNSAGPRSFA